MHYLLPTLSVSESRRAWPRPRETGESLGWARAAGGLPPVLPQPWPQDSGSGFRRRTTPGSRGQPRCCSPYSPHPGDAALGSENSVVTLLPVCPAGTGRGDAGEGRCVPDRGAPAYSRAGPWDSDPGKTGEGRMRPQTESSRLEGRSRWPRDARRRGTFSPEGHCIFKD